MSRVLALDVGGTRCRAALYDDAGRLGAAEVAAGPTASARELEELLEPIRGAVDQVRPGSVDVACAGIAGLSTSGRQAAIAAELWRMLDSDLVIVTSDIVCAHAGALGHRPGVVVAAGTGAVALAVDDGGRAARADGWGYLLGDAGSGFEVGRSGLAAALRAADGRGGSPELLRRAERRYGSRDDVVRLVYGAKSPPRAVAAFAEDMADAARAGDVTAQEAWSRAARDLAETAAAATRRVFGSDRPVAVSYTGGMLDLTDLVTAPFTAALRALTPGARVRPPKGDALDGSRLIAALGGDGQYGAQLYRCHRGADQPEA